MSLLMEALKKAEQAKQSGSDAAAAGGDSLRLEPIDGSSTAAEPVVEATGGNALPNLPAQLDVLDAQFMAHAAEAAAKDAKKTPARETAPPRQAQPAAAPRPQAHAAASAAADGDRKAAQQMFAAKQPEPSRKGFVIAIGGITLISVAAIAGYFWWQLQPKSGLAVSGVARNAPPPAAASMAPPPAQIAAAPLPAAVPPAPTFSAAAAMAKSADDSDDEHPAPRRAAPRTAPPVEAEGPIRVTRSRLKLNPALAQGFEALSAGDLALSQSNYERVLQGEPKNADALHGLAAVALRQGNVAKAEDYWLRALEADPKDALAQAALISSGGRGSSDPQAQESRLKTLIAAQPEIAPLHFALGNVFARQSRWNEAQQAYFKAFSIEPEHPDYIFNLAVSLDHLRQSRLAAQYYGQALAAANQRTAGFDKAQVATRLRELQQ